MTSVEPSPQKRIKLSGQPPSKIPLLMRSQSQSQISSTGTTTTTNGKSAAPAPAPVLTASSSLRFRRIGSPRLSQSPVRKPAPAPAPATPSFFNNTDVSSSVTRMGVDSPLPEQEQATPTPTPRPARPVLAEKTGGGNEKRPREEEQQQQQEPPAKAKSPPPPPPLPRDEDEEALRRLLAERVAVLKTEIEALKDEREKEEARIERESSLARKGAAAATAAAVAAVAADGEGLQGLLRRLLAANDASHTALPALPTLGKEEEEDAPVPSVRPRDSGDAGAFHCLTFTRASCGIYTPAPTTTDDDTTTIATIVDSTPAPLQQYTASGYASSRLLSFTLSFLVDPHSASVRALSATVSLWARAELTAALEAAEDSGDVGAVLYAISSYALMARRRAAVWARCERTFPELLSSAARGKGKGGKVGRREIVRWLGRSVVVFRRAGVELVVAWRVEMDCVGEAESVLSADVRFPGGWKDADDRGSLRKVGEVFTALVKDRGVFEAVRCVVGLVFQ